MKTAPVTALLVLLGGFATAQFKPAVPVCSAAIEARDGDRVTVRGVLEYSELYGTYALAAEEPCSPLVEVKIPLVLNDERGSGSRVHGGLHVIVGLSRTSRSSDAYLVQGTLKRNNWWALGSAVEKLGLFALADSVLDRPLLLTDVFPAFIEVFRIELADPEAQQALLKSQEESISGQRALMERGLSAAKGTPAQKRAQPAPAKPFAPKKR